MRVSVCLFVDSHDNRLGERERKRGVIVRLLQLASLHPPLLLLVYGEPEEK